MADERFEPPVPRATLILTLPAGRSNLRLIE